MCCVVAAFSHQIFSAEAQVQFQAFVVDKVELGQVFSNYRIFRPITRT